MALSRPLQIPADSQPAVHLLGRSMPSASSSLASFIISYACTYFVHNLYTKIKTATNHVSNLHPRCLYAGNISKHTKNAKTYDDADVLSADLL